MSQFHNDMIVCAPASLRSGEIAVTPPSHNSLKDNTLCHTFNFMELRSGVRPDSLLTDCLLPKGR